MPSKKFHLIATAFALGAGGQVALATPLLLSQSPPTLPRDPAPNIIVSVDNSTSMGDTGIAELKTALRATFAATNIPDNQIRLAWQSMHGCNSIPGNSTTCSGFNGMRRLAGTHRTNFENWVNTIGKVRGTPSHYMMDNAGQYLSATGLGINSPWGSNPGVVEEPVLSCRRSYHILMTDGEYGHSWATGERDTSGPPGTRIVRDGNADGTAKVLPDGTPYSVDPSNSQTRLYRDIWGSSTLSSLSDLGFYYWSRDLQPGIPNNLKPMPAEQFPRQNFGTTSSPAELDPYWNPRNNPATWQHMVTYTIGFKAAAQWSTATEYPRWMGDTFSGLAPLIRGEKSWVTPFCNASASGTGNLPCDGGANYENRADARKADLWHTALNSRGRFVPAPDAQSLIDAFKGILADLNAENGQARVSIAASSSQMRTDGRIYLASYNMERFSGEVAAHRIDAVSHAVDTQPTWTSSTTLDATGLDWANRRILSHSGASGIHFNWTSLSAEQQTAIRGPDTATVGTQRVDYLRGNRSLEAPAGAFRQRASRMGTIVNSNLWTVAAPRRLGFEHPGHASFRSTRVNRPETVYVGANDGMLHGFDAATGAERFAYVPRAAIHGLKDYTSPQYTHRFFVDGHPFTGDADLSWVPNGPTPDPTWRTVLVSGLGGGGRGFFVLDVTDPTNVTSTSVLLDKTFPGNVTGSFDGHQDVGHIYGAPVTNAVSGGRSEQIVKLNNGRWAVVLGNGVNSFNERPVLLIQFLDGDKSLKRIIAHSALNTSNGLAPPRLIDLNGNGTVDIAYAGDLQGQLWKFDLSSKVDTDWGVSVWNGTAQTCNDATTCVPFFVARDSASPANAQPITTAPMWMNHPLGGVQIMFGTGQNIQPGDPANTRVQTVYSVWDKSTFTRIVDESGNKLVSLANAHPIATGRSLLVQQSVTTAVTKAAAGGVGTVDTIHSNSTDNAVVYSRSDNTAKRGWFMDLPLSGERVLNPPSPFQGQRALIPSTAPSPTAGGESCESQGAAGQSRLTVLNMITGRPSSSPVFFSSDASMNLSKATSMMVASDELVSINAPNLHLDLLTISNEGYGADSGPGSGLGTAGNNGEGNAQSCAGNGCVNKDAARLGESRGARADWREVR